MLPSKRTTIVLALVAASSLFVAAALPGCDGTAGDPAVGLEAGADATPSVDGPDAASDALLAPEPASDLARDVESTRLELDITARTGKATIRVAPSPMSGLSFEIGDLDIKTVTLDSSALKFSIADNSVSGGALKKRRLDIGVPTGTAPAEVVITYVFAAHTAFDGWMPATGLSFLWPYFCSNLFPCHSSPADGSTFELKVSGVPAGKTAVYPSTIPFDAPTYMPAIAIGDFSYTKLGATSKGTEVGYYALPGEADGGVVAATSKLVDIFNWYETTLGAYRFGGKVAALDAKWGPGAFGGMEHHPYFHVASGAFGDENVHAHEAAHGWFGNAVRIKCWEDFVLSEGTVTYLAARATEVVRGTWASDLVWADYRSQLDKGVKNGDTKAWPQTCNAIDMLKDPLWSNIPYMKGAFFYRKIAVQVGATKLDQILAKFYQAYQGKAASMSDMLALIKTESGFDPAALADKYLKTLGNPEL